MAQCLNFENKLKNMKYNFSNTQLSKIKNIVEKYNVFNKEMISIKNIIDENQKRLMIIEKDISKVMAEEEAWIIAEANELKITPIEFKESLKQFLIMAANK